MDPDSPLPFRPRLADHVMLRRHVVDGEERIVVHDTHTDEVMQISRRELQLLRCADGTRDLGGVVLAAVQKGAYRRSSELLKIFGDLQEREMLADGIDSGEPHREQPLDRSLDLLADYRLSCDHNGMCCGTYSSVPFSRREAERACALVPDALDPAADLSELFLPVQGSVSEHYGAVSMIDGHCPYLADDGRCRVQLAAGADAKPRGCRIFPATFVDDGSCVRVSVGVECACVLRSAGEAEGDELVPAGANRESDLWPGTHIKRLDATLPLTAERSASREELHHWSAALRQLAGALDDPLSAFWWLADSVRDEGLNATAAAASLNRASTLTPAALVFPLMSLAGRAQAKDESVRTWRGTRDRTRQLATWLAAATQSLQDTDCVAARLAEPPPHLEHERFYWLATLHGHHLVQDTLSLEQALRDRATRLLLGRQLAAHVPPECADHPAVPYPITAVEAMMRGQGLDAYATR